MKTSRNKPEANFRILLALTGIALASIILVRELLIVEVSILAITISFVVALSGVIISLAVARQIKPDVDRNPIARLFISFSRHDKDFVDKLSSDLRKSGFQVLRGDEILLGGDNIKQKMSLVMRKADFFIVVLSSKFEDSNYLRDETDYAIENDKRVFPVLIESGENFEIPSSLLDVFYVDFTQDYESAFDILLKSINENVVRFDIHSQD